MTGLGEQGQRVWLRSWDWPPFVRCCCFLACAFPGAQHSGFPPVYRYDTKGVRAFPLLQPRPCGQQLGNSRTWSASSCPAGAPRTGPPLTGPHVALSRTLQDSQAVRPLSRKHLFYQGAVSGNGQSLSPSLLCDQSSGSSPAGQALLLLSGERPDVRPRPPLLFSGGPPTSSDVPNLASSISTCVPHFHTHTGPPDLNLEASPLCSPLH